MPLKTDPFTWAELPAFLTLAKQEGWQCDQWEFAFLLRHAPQLCHVISETGQPRAFITAISYGETGWIGNLIVAPDCRRQGLGRILMQGSLTTLCEHGTEIVWLTASSSGATLYEQLGFTVVDRIERWVGSVTATGYSSPAKHTLADIVTADRQGWGEPRTALLQEKMSLGSTWLNAGACIVLQGTENGLRLGPWSGEPESAAALLDKALGGSPGGDCFLDVPARNRLAAEILTGSGFSRCSETQLMCRGDAGGYDPAQVFALGTMGSIG